MSAVLKDAEAFADLSLIGMSAELASCELLLSAIAPARPCDQCKPGEPCWWHRPFVPGVAK